MDIKHRHTEHEDSPTYRSVFTGRLEMQTSCCQSHVGDVTLAFYFCCFKNHDRRFLMLSLKKDALCIKNLCLPRSYFSALYDPNSKKSEPKSRLLRFAPWDLISVCLVVNGEREIMFWSHDVGHLKRYFSKSRKSVWVDLLRFSSFLLAAMLACGDDVVHWAV